MTEKEGSRRPQRFGCKQLGRRVIRGHLPDLGSDSAGRIKQNSACRALRGRFGVGRVLGKWPPHPSPTRAGGGDRDGDVRGWYRRWCHEDHGGDGDDGDGGVAIVTIVVMLVTTVATLIKTTTPDTEGSHRPQPFDMPYCVEATWCGGRSDDPHLAGEEMSVGSKTHSR